MTKTEILDIWVFAIPASLIYGALSLIGLFINLWTLESSSGEIADLREITAISKMLFVSLGGPFCDIYMLVIHFKKTFKRRNPKKKNTLFLCYMSWGIFNMYCLLVGL